MATHYGRHAYILCQGRREHGPCRAFHIVYQTSDPVGAGDVLVHQMTARMAAEADGWEIGGPDGPDYCPEHRTKPAAPVPTEVQEADLLSVLAGVA